MKSRKVGTNVSAFLRALLSNQIVMNKRWDKAAAVQDVVGALHEAAALPEQWSDALDRVYRLFDAMAAHFFLWNETIDQPVSSHGSTTYLGQQDALKYYLRIDPRRVLLGRGSVGATILCHQHFDDKFVRQNEFFQDYSLPLNRRYLMATKLQKVGATASILALMRSPRQGPFGPNEHALLEHLRPDLQRVARVHRQFQQLSQDRQIERDLLDGLATSLIATDAAAFVVRMNSAAEALLSAGDGLRIVSGRLVAWQRTQTETLHRLIAKAASGRNRADGDGLIVDRPSGERHGVMVMRLGRRATLAVAPEPPLVSVIVTSLDQRPKPDHALIEMFDLTPTEARLAAEMAAGQRLDVLAAEHDVRMSTLRTQLRAIYRKTNTSRQAELVHLVSSLPTLRGRA